MMHTHGRIRARLDVFSTQHSEPNASLKALERALLSMMLGAKLGRVERPTRSVAVLCMHFIYGELGAHRVELQSLT